ncbi:MAG: hypothetical protein RL571_1378 [Pseudomonadota bacterium]
MKKVACHQMQIVSEDEFHLISGGEGEGGEGGSMTDNLQTVLSGDMGCVAGANAARGWVSRTVGEKSGAVDQGFANRGGRS